MVHTDRIGAMKEVPLVVLSCNEVARTQRLLVAGKYLWQDQRQPLGVQPCHKDFGFAV